MDPAVLDAQTYGTVHLYRIGMGQTDREYCIRMYIAKIPKVETSVTKLGKKSVLKVCLRKCCQNLTRHSTQKMADLPSPFSSSRTG
jgi:hypothetical protein